MIETIMANHKKPVEYDLVVGGSIRWFTIYPPHPLQNQLIIVICVKFPFFFFFKNYPANNKAYKSF